MVILLTATAAAPIAASSHGGDRDGIPAPDLYIVPASIVIQPSSPTQGLPAAVSFTVGNKGEQNAFDIEVLMRVDGVSLNRTIVHSLDINETLGVSLNYTPMSSGPNVITLISWFGPSSAKLDQDWSNNNVTTSAIVLSRPDAQVLDSEVKVYLGAVENPPSIIDGDTLTIRFPVHNLGTSTILSCNVTLWETMGGGTPVQIARQSNVQIAGNSSVPITFTWNTTGWAGKRTLIVDVTDVMPFETDHGNNMAIRAVKIHTKEDLTFSGNEKPTIDTAFKVNFFITVMGDAVLTVTSTGNATVYQDFPEQFDIEVKDRASLIIDGGVMAAALNYTIHLSGSAKLVIKNGATTTNLRIVSDTAATILLQGSNLTSPSVTMAGGSLTVKDSTLQTSRLLLMGTSLDVTNSTLLLGETLVITGRATLKDTYVLVRREFPTPEAAIMAYPSIEFYDPETKRVDDLPPAILADNGAQVDLINVSANSTVFTTNEKVDYWTENRLGARGATSQIDVYRYLDIEVDEWSGKVVPGATVEVLDYFDDIVKTSGTTGLDGHVALVVRTDYIKENLKPFVGNLRVRATFNTQRSEDIRFSHYKYPSMDWGSNVYRMSIVLPPSDVPVVSPPMITYTTDQAISGGIDRNIVIDNCVVTVSDSELVIEQDHAFQWTVLIKGQKGMLHIDNSTFGSPYTFIIYLQGNGKLVLTDGSDMRGARVVAFDQSSVQMQGSSVTGDIWTACQDVEFKDCHMSLYDTHIEATKVLIDGGTITAEKGFRVIGHQVEVRDVELTNAYELSKQVGLRDIKSFTTYYGWAKLDGLAATSNASLLMTYFKEFAKGVNITISGDLVTIQGAFIYAAETNVLVSKNPNTPQTLITDSWIGGGKLTILSDDLHAQTSSFNRPLDHFTGSDKAQLYSVQLPWDVCYDNATVERYWQLTVHSIDGAGSVRPGAKLEVYSTETNKSLVADNLRTNAAGVVTVPILANMTDRTGDYFVGSIRFRLVFDQLQFVGNPTYTPWVRIAIKSDYDSTARFAETIESPVKEIQYVIYNLTTIGPTKDLKLFFHTFRTQDAAMAFLNDTVNVGADRVRTWDVVRGTTASMALAATALINGEWIPLEGGQGAEVRIYILNSTATDQPDITRAHRNSDGRVLSWVIWPDIKGDGHFDLFFPDSTGSYQVYIEISGGSYDPVFQVMKNRLWNFTVVEPPTIEIFNARIDPQNIFVGGTMIVTGTVRYIYSQLGVNGSELTVSGQHLSPQTSLSRENGAFSLSMQAPIVAADNFTVTVTAVDPVTEQKAYMTLTYSVSQPPTPVVQRGTPWVLVYILVIVIVMVAAIGGGAVLFLRRQWGKLVECGECGAFIPANSVKCPKCGVEFETDLARCSECEAWIPADSPSCPVCGTPFTIEVLEKQVAAEEAAATGKPIEEVTTSTSKITPLNLGSITPAKWTDKDETRRRRIKKRVKKRLTVADSDEAVDTGAAEEATDLYVGEAGQEGAQSTRLPGLDVGEESLSEDELSRLLPTEDMLKELMLTTEKSEGAPEVGEEPEGQQALAAPSEAASATAPAAPRPEMLEEITAEQAATPRREAELEEIPTPAPRRPEPKLQRVPLSGPIGEEYVEPALGLGSSEVAGGEAPAEDEGILLKELGLKPQEPSRPKQRPKAPLPKGKKVLEVQEEEGEAPAAGDEALLGDILSEQPAREAPKLCPNCGGNWILYKGGEYTCRICGEKW